MFILTYEHRLQFDWPHINTKNSNRNLVRLKPIKVLNSQSIKMEFYANYCFHYHYSAR